MAINGKLIGKVTFLAGNASARSVDGSIRELTLGDPVFEGDVIVTAEGGNIEIAFDGGRTYAIGANETLTLDAQVFAAGEVQERDAALFPAAGSLGAVAEAILNGNGSLDGLFEDPAAGVTGAGGDDNGSTFVELLRVTESTTRVENGATTIQSDARPQYEPLGVSAGTGADGDDGDTDAGAISVALPATIAPGSGATAIGIGGSTSSVAGGSGVSVLVQDSDPASADLTFTAVTNADGSFGLVADLSSLSRGGLTVTARAVDQNGNALTGISSATMLNAGPAGGADALATLEDTVLSIGPATLLANDQDADGDALAISSVQSAVNGSVALIGGNVVFTPVANFNGPASFTYTITDGQGAGTTTTVNLAIGAVNDPANITPAAATLTETNAPLTASGSLPITDVDSPATFVPGAVAGIYGSLTIDAAGAWNYSAHSAHDALAPGSTYSDVFTVTSADGTTSTITVNIVGTNDAAVISSATRNLVETNAVLTSSGTLTILDADSPATFAAASFTGTYGSLSIGVNGAWNYTASSVHDEFAGGVTYTDVFTVASADGTSSTITINILGSNGSAVIGTAIANLTETDAVLTTSGVLTISDADSDASFVAGARAGSYGSLSIDATGAWTYTASSAHNEFAAGGIYSDVFIVTSADGTQGTITVNITGTNDAAVISSATRNLLESDAVLTASGTLTITDIDSAATFQAATIGGTHGSLGIDAAGAWTYTANSAHPEFVAGATYSDTFIVDSSDGTPASITVRITGTNDAAVLSSAVVDLTETNAALSAAGTLTISDVDSPESFRAATIGGNYGSLTIDAAGNWNYTASSAHDDLAAGALYSETFIVTSDDGTTSTVAVTIRGTNDAAVLGTASVTLIETDAVLTTSGILSISDVDGPATFVAGAVAGTYGSLTIDAAGAWTYTARSAHDELAPGAFYSDTFTVSSDDGATSTVTVRINGSNDAAVIIDAYADLTETNAVMTASGMIPISDVDSPAAFVARTIGGTYGSLKVDANGWVVYTSSSPHNEFVGGVTYTEVFTLTSVDGTASKVTINILGTNDAAVISAGLANLVETNAPLIASGTLTISDVDSVPAFTAATVGGAYGSLTIDAAGNWNYTAGSAHNEFAAGVTYSEAFSVTSADGTVGKVTINIQGTNDAAVLGSATVSLTETNAVLTANGTLTLADPEGIATFVAGTVSGTHGSLTINTAGAWTYTASSAHNEFKGGVAYNETFAVNSTDGVASTVTVNIAGTNDAPTPKNDVNAITEDSASAMLSVTAANGLIQSMAAAAGKDTDPESDPMTIVALRTGTDPGGASGAIGVPLAGAYGALIVRANGSYTYVLRNASAEVQDLKEGESVPDVFTYTVSDGNGGFASATLTIMVHGAMELTSAPATLSALPSVANSLSGDDFGNYLGYDSLGGGLGADIFAWELADEGAQITPASDTITDGYGRAGTLDLGDLLVAEHASTGENQTVALSDMNLYSATGIGAGDDANLLRMLIKMGTLRAD